jgi:ankyrin repeat protein
MTPDEATEKLFEAAINGNVSDARTALDAEAEVNARDYAQGTPLHLAAECGNTDVARLLIEKGADVNAKNDCQQTPLHLAALHGHADVAKVLAEAEVALAQKACQQMQGLGADGKPFASRVTEERKGAAGDKDVGR